MNWAFNIVKETNDCEALCQKKYYDKRMCCQKLTSGDLVLVKQEGSLGNYKIDDK